MSRFLTRALQALVLASIFIASATITSHTCSVTNRQIVQQSINECYGTNQWIYKYELNRITFSDGDFDNVEVESVYSR